MSAITPALQHGVAYRVAHHDHAIPKAHQRSTFLDIVMNGRHQREAPTHAAKARNQRAGHHVRMHDIGTKTLDQPAETRNHGRHAPGLARLLQQLHA